MLKESAVVMSYDAETGIAKVNVNHKAPVELVRLEKPVEQLPFLNLTESEANISSRSKPSRPSVQVKW